MITTYSILCELYKNKNITDGEQDMFETMNKDYYISTCRESIKRLWSTENNIEFFCKISFLNILKQKVFEVKLKEDDIRSLINCMSQLFTFGSMSTSITFDCSSTVVSYIIFKFDYTFDMNNEVIITMTVLEYNSISECMIPKIKIDFNEYYFNNFIHYLFFNFLIDIEDEYSDNDYIPF